MNSMIKCQVKADSKRFVDSLNRDAICALASSYHHGTPCSPFGEPLMGSYNVCFPVAFTLSESCSRGDRWVVRIPMSPAVAFVDEKLENEIATMNYIAERTRIPIPRVHGYSFQRESPIGVAFVILDYIQGETLLNIGITTLDQQQKAYLYDQLADIYIQLYDQRFPHIGALSLPSSGAGAGASWTFDSHRRPLTIEVNAQEVEGLDPTKVLGLNDTFTSSRDYISSLMQLAFNQFIRGRCSVHEEYDGQVAYYYLHQFGDLVRDWIKPKHDRGPFVLVHGDLRPPNFIVDKDSLDILAVIDWEWSHTVPVQLFVPPTWLTGLEPQGICSYFKRKDYEEELEQLITVMKDHESSSVAAPLLSEIWSDLAKFGAFLISYSLLCPCSIDTVYHELFDLVRHKDPLNLRVQAFMEASDKHHALIKKKVQDREAYRQDRAQEQEALNRVDTDTSKSLNGGSSPKQNGFFLLLLKALLPPPPSYGYTLGGIGVMLVGLAYMIHKQRWPWRILTFPTISLSLHQRL